MSRVKMNARISVYSPTIGPEMEFGTAIDVETIVIEVPELPWLRHVEIILRPGGRLRSDGSESVGYVQVNVRTQNPVAGTLRSAEMTVHGDGGMEASSD